MPQAPLKKKTSTKPPRGKLAGISKSNGGLKKGAKVITPKKGDRLKMHNVSKKLTSGLTERTERMLAERAGHLEVLGGGKKDKKKEAAGGKS